MSQKNRILSYTAIKNLKFADSFHSSTIHRINPNCNNPIPTSNRINIVPVGGRNFSLPQNV
jgi:hypothetical protein